MKRVIKDENDLKTKAPEIAAEWDFEQNSGFPEDYFYGSTERVNWICSLLSVIVAIVHFLRHIKEKRK
jgi:hypothetical protein